VTLVLALAERAVIRRHLEAKGRLLCCQGARADVWPSGLLRQFTDGRCAYVLERDRGGRPLEEVDIFSPAPAQLVVTVAAQERAVRAFHGLPEQAE
jgi:hypothetical protein